MRFFELSADAWRVFRARDEQQSSPLAASTPEPAGSSCTKRSICDQRSSRRARLETRQSQSKGPCIFRENHFASSPIWSRPRLGRNDKRIVAPQQSAPRFRVREGCSVPRAQVLGSVCARRVALTLRGARGCARITTRRTLRPFLRRRPPNPPRLTRLSRAGA